MGILNHTEGHTSGEMEWRYDQSLSFSLLDIYIYTFVYMHIYTYVSIYDQYMINVTSLRYFLGNGAMKMFENQMPGVVL